VSTQPAYLFLLKTGELGARVQALDQILTRCQLCPRKCCTNRQDNEPGQCGIGRYAWVSSHGPHHGEENPLRGWNGSGTIFFSGCNLSCIFCQNAEISQQLAGRPVTAGELAAIMLELQEQGCHNINLVSPTHVIAQIVEAVFLAARDGLHLPLVYNSGGYDSQQILKYLDGVIDIYMPDMKYSNPEIGLDLSGVPDYPEVNQLAVLEMHRQVGDLQLDEKGIAIRGLLVRHLVLPGGLAGSRDIFRFIARKISLNTYLNIMDQYRPAYRAYQVVEINRPVPGSEYQDILKDALELGFTRLDSRPR
jgi:putative pyruvate formate lyase activating enzyme